MHKSPPNITPPAGGATYYPARRSGTYRNTRAALASLGVYGVAAERCINAARGAQSDLVAVPPIASNEAAELIAFVRRKQGGRALRLGQLLRIAVR